jgi:ABC-type phosphate transport system substrate-binding protein
MKTLKSLMTASIAMLVCLTGVARAQTPPPIPDCTDTTMVGTNPIYLAGSSAFQAAAQAMALQLNTVTGADHVTIIYKSSASCDGVNDILNNADLSGTATYFTLDTTMTPPAPVALSCNLPTGTKADVGVSDIFFETCPGMDTRPDTVGDIPGPVQAMLIIVPEANTTFTAISAAEAQDVWGCGMAGMVSPFTDENGIMQRNSGSGTQNIIAKHINVAAGAFKGVMNSTGGNLVSMLLAYAANNPQKAIGFLAADSYDANRAMLNSVAFRAFEQTKAYYADSASDTFDKRNVRDGHYLPWGPEHFLVQLGTDGKPTNAKAAKFLSWMDGSATVGTLNFTQILAKASLIPQCAMKVTRSSDGGLLSPYTPPDPCGCFFESTVNNMTPANCVPCTDNTACSSDKTCHHGFCE